MAEKPTLQPGEREVLRAVRARIVDPKAGLPDEVFGFAVALVPMINVDLLVLDSCGRVLLAWREDELSQGWHVPGSIVRGRETFRERLDATAAGELGIRVRPGAAPAAIVEIFGQRGHFISMVHTCEAVEPPRVTTDVLRPAAGDLAWFDGMPPNTYPSHGFYFDLIPRLREGPTGPPVMLQIEVDESAHRADHPAATDTRLPPAS